MHMRSYGVLLLSLAVAGGLSACKEPAPPVDFAPVDSGTATAPRASGLGVAATEVPPQLRALAGSAGRCNLERVNGQSFGGTPIKVSKGKPVGIVGWIADPDAKGVPTTNELRFILGDRVWRAPIQANDARSDVQGLLGGDAAYVKTGHVTQLDLSALPDGTYRVYIAFARDGATYACDNGRMLDVGP